MKLSILPQESKEDELNVLSPYEFFKMKDYKLNENKQGKHDFQLYYDEKNKIIYKLTKTDILILSGPNFIEISKENEGCGFKLDLDPKNETRNLTYFMDKKGVTFLLVSTKYKLLVFREREIKNAFSINRNKQLSLIFEKINRSCVIRSELFLDRKILFLEYEDRSFEVLFFKDFSFFETKNDLFREFDKTNSYKRLTGMSFSHNLLDNRYIGSFENYIQVFNYNNKSGEAKGSFMVEFLGAEKIYNLHWIDEQIVVFHAILKHNKKKYFCVLERDNCIITTYRTLISDTEKEFLSLKKVKWRKGAEIIILFVENENTKEPLRVFLPQERKILPFKKSIMVNLEKGEKIVSVNIEKAYINGIKEEKKMEYDPRSFTIFTQLNSGKITSTTMIRKYVSKEDKKEILKKPHIENSLGSIVFLDQIQSRPCPLFSSTSTFQNRENATLQQISLNLCSFGKFKNLEPKKNYHLISTSRNCIAIGHSQGVTIFKNIQDFHTLIMFGNGNIIDLKKINSNTANISLIRGNNPFQVKFSEVDDKLIVVNESKLEIFQIDSSVERYFNIDIKTAKNVEWSRKKKNTFAILDESGISIYEDFLNKSAWNIFGKFSCFCFSDKKHDLLVLCEKIDENGKTKVYFVDTEKEEIVNYSYLNHGEKLFDNNSNTNFLCNSVAWVNSNSVAFGFSNGYIAIIHVMKRYGMYSFTKASYYKLSNNDNEHFVFKTIPSYHNVIMVKSTTTSTLEFIIPMNVERCICSISVNNKTEFNLRNFSRDFVLEEKCVGFEIDESFFYRYFLSQGGQPLVYIMCKDGFIQIRQYRRKNISRKEFQRTKNNTKDLGASFENRDIRTLMEGKIKETYSNCIVKLPEIGERNLDDFEKEKPKEKIIKFFSTSKDEIASKIFQKYEESRYHSYDSDSDY